MARKPLVLRDRVTKVLIPYYVKGEDVLLNDGTYLEAKLADIIGMIGTGGYTPPPTGIPADDLAGNIPLSKLSDTVQQLLALANTALQEQTQADWDEENSSSPAFIQNKPEIPEGVEVAPSVQQGDTRAVAGGAVYNELQGKASATTVALLRESLDAITGGDTTTAIETFQEVIDFLQGVTDDATLIGKLNELRTLINAKVDKESGKSLMTDAEHTKLAGIAAGAEVNVQPNWTQTNTSADDYIKNKPTLATVATSGSYNDLTNKPTIPTNVSDLNNDSGFTSNAGTITGITMNGASKGTSGVVDLGTVITAHQDISGKANASDVYTKTQTDTLLAGKQDSLTSSTILMTINGDDIHFGDSVTVEGEQGPQGQKGNSVVDGDSFEIVNNLTEGGDADALSADMGIVLKRNIGILNNNIHAMMTALANLAFSNARPTLAQLDWTALTHSVTLVTTGLSHCSASADAKVAHGGNLVITLSPNSGYVLDGVTPTISASSGTVSTAVSGDNILITVANVTADVTVTISATAVTAPLSLHLSLSHCSCSSHADGQTIIQGSTISVVLNADTNYTLSQNDIAVTGGTAQVTISNNGATATISIAVSGDASISAEAVFSLEYVNDGLVFHLDGSDTGGSNDNEWVDKIGGIVFKNNGNCTPELGSNGDQIGWSFPVDAPKGYFAVMDGDTWNNDTDGSKVMTNLVTENGVTHFIIGTANGAAIGSKQVTIEVVTKLADNMMATKSFIFMGSKQSSSATDWNAPFMNINTQSSSLRLYGNSSKHWSYTATANQKATISMSSDRAYANGSPLSNVAFTSKHADTNEGGVFIGATRGSGYTAPTNVFSGSIYAVRIYNRVLTADEVLHNQYVDNEQYELGLSITDPMS